MKKKDSSSWSEIKSLDERLVRDPDSFCFARLSEILLFLPQGTGVTPSAFSGLRRIPAKHRPGNDRFAVPLLHRQAIHVLVEYPRQPTVSSQQS